METLRMLFGALSVLILFLAFATWHFPLVMQYFWVIVCVALALGGISLYLRKYVDH